MITKSAHETFAPSTMPKGMKKKFATECSRPMVTKAAMGGHRPRTLPGIVVAELALKVAMHTNLYIEDERTKYLLVDWHT